MVYFQKVAGWAHIAYVRLEGVHWVNLQDFPFRRDIECNEFGEYEEGVDWEYSVLFEIKEDGDYFPAEHQPPESLEGSCGRVAFYDFSVLQIFHNHFPNLLCVFS